MNSDRQREEFFKQVVRAAKEQNPQAKRQYESKIEEFLLKTEESGVEKSSEQRKKGRKNTDRLDQFVKQEKMEGYVSKESQKAFKMQESLKSQQSGMLISRQSTSFRSQQSSEQRRKPHGQGNPINPQPQKPQHQHLLQKISTQIQQLNEQISTQISSSQNGLLQQFERELTQKQQQLNRLRLITNEQMIRQKTLERKEQLRREKESLIEGNFYLDGKLEELKKEVTRLMEKREAQRKTLAVLMRDDEVANVGNSREKLNPKRKKTYFNQCSDQQYIDQVLSSYNEKNPLLNQSLTNSIIVDNRSVLHNNNSNANLTLPKIVQKSENINNNIKGQPYIHIPVNRRIDRAKSFGNSMLDASQLQQSAITNSNNKQRQYRFFSRYNNQLKSNIHKDMTSGSQNSKATIKNSKTISTSQPQQSPNTTVNNSLAYTKQYLEKFVVKKTKKQQTIVKKPQFKGKSLEQLAKKEKMLQEKFGHQLKIEELFNGAVQKYYIFREKTKKIHTQTSETQQQQDPQQQLQECQAKSPQKLHYQLQANHFDKKLIIDILLNDPLFKRYVHQLIISQLDKKYQYQGMEQALLNKFENQMYSMKE